MQAAVADCGRGLIVDECRRTGSVSEELVTGLVEPWLIPEMTTFGGSPKAPRAAMSAIKPGPACTACAGTPAAPASSRRSTRIRPSDCVAMMEALDPLDCAAGAAITGSNPAR